MNIGIYFDKQNIMKTIKLEKFWTNLVSRPLAKKIFLEAQMEDFNVIFDCKNINFISSSFADELFAKWIEDFWKNFKITNLSNKPLLVEIIRQAFITREKYMVTTC